MVSDPEKKVNGELSAIEGQEAPPVTVHDAPAAEPPVEAAIAAEEVPVGEGPGETAVAVQGAPGGEGQSRPCVGGQEALAGGGKAAPAAGDPPKDPASEFRGQRHEFILAYYDMAVKDLERHLKMGWQTIATAAGAIATLSAGQQGYLPIPVAVLLALVICFWGIDNLIDSNYWAIRAIAFLANVEAIYFYKEDRTYFNPYAGGHPALKWMDSLKSQFIATAFITVIALFFYVLHIGQGSADFTTLGIKIVSLSYFKAYVWISPFISLIVLICYLLWQWKKRLDDYLKFVTDAPGPGMVKDRSKFRPLDPAPPLTAVVAIEPAAVLQEWVRTDLENSSKSWEKWFPKLCILCGILILLLLIMVPVIKYVLSLYFSSWPDVEIGRF